MLQPSENFGAEQIRFLQNEATDWIKYVNQEIIKAANDGKNEAYIDITSRKDNIGFKFYNAPDALIEHFKSRGFGYESGGQSYILIKW